MKISYSLFCFAVALISLSACGDNKSTNTVTQAQANKPHVIRDTLRGGGGGPELVIIPAGSGFVGDNTGEGPTEERPFHKVVAKIPFAMSTTEITFEDYDRFCKTTGESCPDDKGWGRGKQPVINVSWTDAVAYTKWLSDQTGHTYRLPSEAEWEYAARAGSKGRFWWGDKYIQGKDHCDKDIGGCPEGTALFNPGPVGRFQPNPFGLYDMTSNVSEWTLDCWNPQHDEHKSDLSARLTGDCDTRVIKGGAYNEKASYLSLSHRIEGVDYQTLRMGSLGFRVVRELQP